MRTGSGERPAVFGQRLSAAGIGAGYVGVRRRGGGAPGLSIHYHPTAPVQNRGMTEHTPEYTHALETAERILGFSLAPFVDPRPYEPTNAYDFTRIATEHAFNDAWPRTDHLDVRTRALVSVTITASLGVLEPLRGQLRIALHNGVTKEEIVEAFIQMAVYAGVARAFDSYAVAREVFAEYDKTQDAARDKA
ncbi:carboxymuconolactone decarboxylase family protein [Streptomyces sp. RP5T]|uniref:carboxymuconolactone decarboxylase family protein n=1 Tax=Streptomyces sp. RP5T TaxID=2490848 RepID=UPI0021AD5C9F|nr:carboxymuconolactone decarboxylase family protein [Streptomyces sp. RP5T]